MVWCARESADYKPGKSSAMQFFEHFGWIHWDSNSRTWHTVTGYELGHAGAPPDATQLPGPAALVADDLGYAGGVAEAVADALSADQGPDGEDTDGAGSAGAVSAGAGPAGTGPAEAAEIPVALAMHAGTADATTWDTEHKRDEDRADTQHTLENTRWDTQHTLDNTRWDTRHTLENTRWDTYLALKRTREDTALAADMALLSAVHSGYVAVAQSSLDRAVQRATYVTTAAGAIGTIYTAILAARYTTGHPAPARSIIPALFVGAAIAFSTWYMAFLRGTTRKQQLLVSGTGGKVAETRLLDFMEWAFSGVLARSWSLRISVISLALGLAMLPLGLVQLGSGVTWLVGILALLILVLWIAGELYIALNGPPAKVQGWLDRLESRRPRLAFQPPDLPAAPRTGFADTGLGSFGLAHLPPAAPLGSASANPPPAPDAAAGLPPRPFDLLAPNLRPAAPPPVPSPTDFKVDLRVSDDRGSG